MENAIVAIDGAALPAHLQGKDSNKAGGLVVSADSLPRISAKDAQFVLRDGDKEMKLPIGQSLPIVILGVDPAEGTSKSYYATGWTEGSSEAPDCSAANGTTPDSWVAQAQNPDCTTCPHNQWGSGRDQSGEPTKGKRCSDRKNLIVTIGGKLDKTMFILSIAPTSLKNLSRYGRTLGKHGVAPENVTTIVGFDPDKPKVLAFDFGGFLSEAENTMAEQRAASSEVLDHITGAAPVPEVTAAPVAAVVEPLPAAPAVADTSEFFKEPVVAQPVVVQEPVVAQEPVAQEPVAPAVAEVAAELDTAGLPWDARINAKNKAKTVGGTWKMGRGINPETIQAVHAELRGATPVAPAAVVEPAAPVASPAAVAAPPEPVVAPADAGGPPGGLDSILSDWE